MSAEISALCLVFAGPAVAFPCFGLAFGPLRLELEKGSATATARIERITRQWHL